MTEIFGCILLPFLWYSSIMSIFMNLVSNRSWPRSLVQHWFLLNIATMERVPLLNRLPQKIWDICHRNKHFLIWLLLGDIIRQVTNGLFTSYPCKKLCPWSMIVTFLTKLKIQLKGFIFCNFMGKMICTIEL